MTFLSFIFSAAFLISNRNKIKGGFEEKVQQMLNFLPTHAAERQQSLQCIGNLPELCQQVLDTLSEALNV